MSAKKKSNKSSKSQNAVQDKSKTQNKISTELAKADVDAVDVIPLDKKTTVLAQEIIDEEDLDRVKSLTTLFNLNQAKKNVLRIIKLNSLLDKVSNQMIERFEKKPGEFSNGDLLEYLTVTQSAIDRAQKSLDLVDDTPAIQLQQNNQVNINLGDSLDRESKERVTDAVKAILARIKSTPIELAEDEVIDATPVNTEDSNTNETEDVDSDK